MIATTRTLPCPRFAWLLAALLLAATPVSTATAATPHREARMIDWDALLPDDERAHYNPNPPAPIHGYLGEAAPAVLQSGSAVVNRKLNGVRVKVPGYIVPLDMDGTGRVKTFFLVPYLGACIHVPPPPPNQIVYVILGKGGVRFGTLDEPYWVTGTLRTVMNGTRVAKASYTLVAQSMERYQY